MRWIHEQGEEIVYRFWLNYFVSMVLFFIGFFVLMHLYLQENTKMGFLVNVLFFLPVAYLIYKTNRQIQSFKSWIPLQADVISVQIVFRNCGRRPYYPKIKYRYTIDNHKYMSDRVFLQTCSTSLLEEKARQMAKSLIDENDKITCYVNPLNHEESVVSDHVEEESYLMWGLLIFFPSFIFIMSA